jgi:single-strand DNA-binding protein
MYALKNKVTLVGNMGDAATVKNIGADKKVANFSLATNEVTKNEKGERSTETQWHRLKAWGKVAEIIEKYTKKGSELMVEGKLIYSSYQDKDNVTRYVTEIEVREVLILDKREAS